MKNHSKLVGVIVVLLLLLFGWRWWTARQVKPVEAQEKVATASSPTTVVPSISNRVRQLQIPDGLPMQQSWRGWENLKL